MKSLILYLLCIFTVIGCDSENTSENGSTSSISNTSQEQVYSFSDYDSIKLSPVLLRRHNLYFNSPVTWQHSVESGLDIWKIPCTNNNLYCANFMVNIVPVTKVNSLDNYSTAFVVALKEKEDVADFKLVGNTRDTIDGNECSIIDFKYSLRGNDVGGTAMLLLLRNKLLIMSFTAPNDPPKSYVRYRGLYNRIIKSVGFVK